LWGNAAALLGTVVLVVVMVAALAAPWLAPHDPTDQNIVLRLRPPALMERGSSTYPLGTDALGRDVLSRVIFGARISLMVGVASVLIQGMIGVLLGVTAGYCGGRVDSIIMRVTDIQYAPPFLVLALAVMAVLGPGLWNLILVLGATGWVYYARVVRAEALAIRERTFVEAARSIGAPGHWVMYRHVLPNVMSSIIVIASLQVARMIVSEASLSFLGMGVPPAIPSWGGMVAEGRDYIATGWWVSTFAGLAIFLTVISLNLVGDWLRDELDPITKGTRIAAPG
jgi:peptide/nickel transport system permease protein